MTQLRVTPPYLLAVFGVFEPCVLCKGAVRITQNFCFVGILTVIMKNKLNINDPKCTWIHVSVHATKCIFLCLYYWKQSSSFSCYTVWSHKKILNAVCRLKRRGKTFGRGLNLKVYSHPPRNIFEMNEMRLFYQWILLPRHNLRKDLCNGFTDLHLSSFKNFILLKHMSFTDDPPDRF